MLYIDACPLRLALFILPFVSEFFGFKDLHLDVLYLILSVIDGKLRGLKRLSTVALSGCYYYVLCGGLSDAFSRPVE
jgi:hypothetical protein